MNPQEKMAWYMLAVLLLTAVVFLALWTLSGHSRGSGGAFGLLGLLGFAATFVDNKKGKVTADEHDRAISQKAGRVAFQVFWLYFVGFCMLMNFPFNREPTVPSGYFILLLLTGGCLMVATYSISILVLYRSDSSEDDTLVDRFRKMAGVRKVGLWIMLICPLIMAPMVYGMNMLSDGDTPRWFIMLFGFLTCTAFMSIYLGFRRQLGSIASGEGLEQVAAKIRRLGDIALLLGLIGTAGGTGLVWLLPGGDFTVAKIPQVILYGLCCGILGQGLAAFAANSGNDEHDSVREGSR